MTIADLRRQLQPGSIYNATWRGPIAKGWPRLTKRRVVSQSAGLMMSEVLDGPQTGHVMRLEWSRVKATETGGIITLCDEDAIFLQIDTIEG